MSCVTKEQWKEVYKNALAELNDKQELGEDISEALAELKAMDKSMRAGEADKAKKILDKAKESITWLDSSAVAEANNYGPYVGKKKVEVKRIGRGSDGELRYVVDYGKGRLYTRKSYEMTFDKMDPKYNNLGKLNSEASSGKKLSKEYVDLFREIADEFIGATVKFDNAVLFDNMRRDIDKVVPGDYDTNDRFVRVVDDKLAEEFKAWLNADEALALVRERAEANGIDIIVKANPLVDNIDKVIDDKVASKEFRAYVNELIEVKRVELQNKVGVIDNGHVLVHELVHAASYHFMEKVPANEKEKAIQDRINWLFEEAKYQYSRGIEGRKGVKPYWTTNVHEFIAEAMSNPDVIKELDGMQISKVNRLATVLRALVDAIVSLVSTKKNKDSVYYYVVDGLMAVMENTKVAKEDVLGSTVDSIKEMKGKYEKLQYDIWNDQDNAIKLFDELVGVDGLNDEHTAVLRDLLEKITDPTKQILNKFKVLLKREADANRGIAVPYGKGDSRIVLDVMESHGKINGMTAQETYLHELIHMSIETARQFRRGPLADVISDMAKLYKQAEGFVTVEKLMEKGASKKDAEQMFKYVFENKDLNKISEFIAYGMTNRYMKAVLADMDVDLKASKSTREGLWGKMLNWLIEVYDAMRDMISLESDGYKGDERLGWLVSKMWKHNNVTTEKTGVLATIKTLSDKATGKVDTGILKAAGFIGRTLDKTIDLGIEAAVGEGYKDSKAYKYKTFFKVANPFVSGKNAETRDKMLETLRMDFKDTAVETILEPEGMAMGMLNMLKEDDSLTTRVEKLVLIANRIDAHRHDTTVAIGADILKSLGKISKRGQVALTNVMLKTDMKALIGAYEMDEMHELVVDDKKRRKEIEKLKKSIGEIVGDKRRSNYYIAQSKGLGKYMVHGISGRTLNKNAWDIARGSGAETQLKDLGVKDVSIEVMNKVAREIDKLATLYGINETSEQDRVEYGEVVKSEGKGGLESVLKYSLLHKLEEDKFLGDNKFWDREVKGTIKEVTAGYKDSTVYPSDKKSRKEMKNRGFTYVGETAVENMGFYTKNTPEMEAFDKQAFAKINVFKKTHSISKAALVKGKTKLDKDELEKFLKRIEEKDVNGKDYLEDIAWQVEGHDVELDGYDAIRNQYGTLVDYATSLDRDMYESAMKAEISAPYVLGRMIAEVREKVESVANNKKVLREAYIDSDKNYKRGNKEILRREYIELGPDQKNKGEKTQLRAKELWANLPQYIRNEIERQPKGQRWLAIRNDIAEKYIGSRSPSVLNARIPFVPTSRTLEQVLTENDFGHLVEIFKVASEVWGEIVGFIKSSIVVRMPEVIINNLFSNIRLAVALNQPIHEVLKDTGMLFKATKEYLNNKKKMMYLYNRYVSGIDRSEKIQKDIQTLRETLKGSPVHATMRAGLFTAKMEDLSMPELESKGIIESALEKYTDKIPTIVTDVLGALYISRDNPIYQALLMMVQYSDFVYRTMRYNYLVSTGIAPETALKMVTDEAINYSNLLPTSLRWLDKNMALPFMKFTIGANKNMIQKAKETPSALASMFMMGEVFPSPTDAFVLTKNWDAAMNSPYEVASTAAEFGFQPALLRATGVM